jgi:hypothetical protein
MPKRKTPQLREITEETVRSTAHIMGGFSAAAQALADAKCRRAAGETVRFLKYDGGPLIVEGVVVAPPAAQSHQGSAS